MVILFAAKYDSSEVLDMRKIIGGADPATLDRIYNNENYKRGLKLWLPLMNERGYLDKLIDDDTATTQKQS